MVKFGLRKIACVLAVFVALVTGLLLLIYVIHVKKPAQTEFLPTPETFIRHFPRVYDKDICQTKECIEAGIRLLKDMDQSVNPCDNFYKFACGNYEKRTVIPADKVVLGHFFDMSDLVLSQIWPLLEQPIDQNESRVFKMVKTFYQSCMNKPYIEKHSTNQFLETLKMLGGWPVLEADSWNESNFDWLETVHKCKEIGYPKDYFFDVTVTVDHTNNTYRLLKLNEPSFGMAKEFLSKAINAEAFKHFQVNLAVALGADPSRAEEEVSDVLNFEIKLAYASVEKSGNTSDVLSTYNIMTLAEVQNRWSYIQWIEFINKLMPKSVTVDKNERILVPNPEYFDQLGEIIQNTTKRTQANYVMWRAAMINLRCLSDNIRKASMDFITTTTGLAKRGPRWKECAFQTVGSLEVATSAMYVRAYVKPELKEDVNEIVENIREAFIEVLQDADWIDDFTRENAVKKARKIHAHVAYPIEILNDTILEEYYFDLELNSEDFFLNSLKLSKFHTDLRLKKLRQRVNNTDWATHSSTTSINAFYGSFENSLELPAGILQGVLYNTRRPKYMNYARLGMVVGHELSHAFDENGRQYDGEGNLHDWWTNDTKQIFLNKSNCFIEQYSKYTVPELGIKLRGIRTQNENMADHAGIKQAYRAYQSWVKRNKPELKLPGLSKYTPNQLFWISSANLWCGKIRNESLKELVLTSPHPPAEFRVRGPYSNLDIFSKDFLCPPGSSMNPIQKCSMW